MKNILFIMLLFSLNLFAAPVGNPSAPRLIEKGFFIPADFPFNIRTGYEGDFVADARLEQYAESSGRVDDYEQETNAGTLTINFLDRLDLFTVLGSSRTCSNWRFTTADVTHRAQIETLYDFLWGMGARAMFYKYNDLSFAIGARYERSSYDNMWLTIDGLVQPATGATLHWREWQVDLDMSYKIDIFVPYIGIKYSNVRAKVGSFATPISNDGKGFDQFKNRTPVGVFIGCSLSSGQYFMLNIEGRLIDEEAVTISGDLRF